MHPLKTSSVGAGPRASPHSRNGCACAPRFVVRESFPPVILPPVGGSGWHGGLPLQRVHTAGVFNRSARRFLFSFLTYNVHELRTYNVHEYLFMIDYKSLINGHSCEKWLHTLVVFNRSAWRFLPVIAHPGLLFAKRFRLLSYRLSAVRAGTAACPYSWCLPPVFQSISVCLFRSRFPPTRFY